MPELDNVSGAFELRIVPDSESPEITSAFDQTLLEDISEVP